MSKDLSLNKKHIVSLLDQNELLLKADLVHLSDLTEEELAFLNKTWQKADIKRRRKIISDLLKLSEEDFRYNFSGLFAFCLQDGDSIIRTKAIAGLELEEDCLHIPLLIEIIRKDRSAEVREAAVKALGRFALLGELEKLSQSDVDAVYTVLPEILENYSEPVQLRCQALEAIAPLNFPRVKQLIEEAYQSQDILLKAGAISAMGINNQPFWLDILLDELDNNEFKIRYEAVRACGELGIERALSYILKILETGDVPIQEVAITALGEIGGEQARQALDVLKKNPKKRLSNAAKMALKEMDICDDPLSLDF